MAGTVKLGEGGQAESFEPSRPAQPALVILMGVHNLENIPARWETSRRKFVVQGLKRRQHSWSAR